MLFSRAAVFSITIIHSCNLQAILINVKKKKKEKHFRYLLYLTWIFVRSLKMKDKKKYTNVIRVSLSMSLLCLPWKKNE